MPAIYTSASFHNVRDIRAHESHSLGAPFTLTLTDSHGHTSTVTIFVGDDRLAKRLVDAINAAMLPVPDVPDAARQAAHEAEQRHYGGLR